MVRGAAVRHAITGERGAWIGLAGTDRARVEFHRAGSVYEPLLTDVEFDFGLGDEDMGGECVLCGAPGGYPYCNEACREADRDEDESEATA